MKTITRLLSLVCIVAIIMVGYKFYQAREEQINQSNLEFIQKHVNSMGKLVDFENEIGVKSIDDIKLYVSKEKVRIKFGKIQLDFKYEDLKTKEMKEQLKKIGFDVMNINDSKKLKVYYRGVELVRWAK